MPSPRGDQTLSVLQIGLASPAVGFGPLALAESLNIRYIEDGRRRQKLHVQGTSMDTTSSIQGKNALLLFHQEG
jgi:hypothetical protein